MPIEYQREIRGPEGEVYVETFKFRSDDLNLNQDFSWDLEGDNGCAGKYGYTVHGHGGSSQHKASKPMPDWWQHPQQPMELIAPKYHAGGGKVLLTTLNIVTFVTFMGDGRIQLQRRNFVAPNGKTIGNPGYDSINGGQMKPGETLLQAVTREGREELGVDIGKAARFVGNVYDAEMGRTNHVYRVRGYDKLLAQQLSTEGAIKALVNPEGIGRGFLWREDLNALIKQKLLTGISVAILKAYPRLKPPKNPKSKAK